MVNESTNLRIGPHGERIWFNHEWRVHREDGPAIEWPDGKKEWVVDEVRVK